MANKTFSEFNLLKRKAFYLTFSFFLTPAVTYSVMSGIFAEYPFVFLGVTAVFLTALVILCVKDKKNIKGAAVIAFILMTAFLSSVISYGLSYRNAKSLYEYTGNEAHSFSVYISKEDADTNGSAFAEITAIDGKDITPSVDVTFYNHSGYYLKQGTYLEFKARYQLSDGGDEFDEWRRSKGVYASWSGISEIRTDSERDKYIFTSGVKEFLSDRLLKVLSVIPGKSRFERVYSVGKAMLFGDKGSLDADLKTQFSRSGIIHVLCVSGLHFSVMLGGLSFILKYTLKRRNARYFILFAAAIAYLFLCGFTKSAVRAALMALIGGMCASGARRNYCTYALLLSVCGICIADPKSVFDGGFRMSCICCVGILCSAVLSEMLGKRFAFRPVTMCVLSSLVVSFSASAFLFPYSVTAFGGASTVSVLASTLAVMPAQLFLVICWIALIVSVLGIGIFDIIIAGLLSGLCEAVCSVARFFSELEYSYIETSVPDISFFVFMLVIAGAAVVSVTKRRAASVYLYTLSVSVLMTAIFLAVSIN